MELPSSHHKYDYVLIPIPLAIIEIHGITLQETSKHVETNPVALTLLRRGGEE
jgi:hypothetical protein